MSSERKQLKRPVDGNVICMRKIERNFFELFLIELAFLCHSQMCTDHISICSTKALDTFLNSTKEINFPYKD